jgi:hypothetical protein
LSAKKIIVFEGPADLFIIFLAPTFADQEMLPQTAAFVMETFRWRPVSAGGMCAFPISEKLTGIDFDIYLISRICS